MEGGTVMAIQRFRLSVAVVSHVRPLEFLSIGRRNNEKGMGKAETALHDLQSEIDNSGASLTCWVSSRINCCMDMK